MCHYCDGESEYNHMPLSFILSDSVFVSLMLCVCVHVCVHVCVCVSFSPCFSHTHSISVTSLCLSLNHSLTHAHSQAMDFFRQIVAGVHYVHSKGILHRDLKVRKAWFDWLVAWVVGWLLVACSDFVGCR
jgi:serine/threonine protein kinase